MAQSRLEKVGTIYTRTVALLKAKGIKEENKPMWLDIYEAFPPKYEPTFSRPVPVTLVRQIFYEEDQIRAKFHKDYKQFSMVNLLNNYAISRTEHFLKIYKELKQEGVSDTELYNKAIDKLLMKIKIEKVERETSVAETKFKSQPVQTQKDNIKNLKESVDTVAQDEPSYKPIRLSLEKLLEDAKEESNNKSE